MVAFGNGLFEELAEQIAPDSGCGGRPRLRRAERGQVELRALRLDDLVPADHRVRLVWAFAEKLDLGPLYAVIKAVEGRPGHPPADPRVLMAVWLYATIDGVGSARAPSMSGKGPGCVGSMSPISGCAAASG